jgi:hypothetical protein
MIKNTFLVPARRTLPFQEQAQSGVISKLAARMQLLAKENKIFRSTASNFAMYDTDNGKSGLRLSHPVGKPSVHYDLPQNEVVRRISAL